MEEEPQRQRREDDMRYVTLLERIAVVETKLMQFGENLVKNTELTQQAVDMMRVSRLVQSLLKWLIGITAGVVAIWQDWGGRH